MERNKEQTKEKLIKAVRSIIKKEGFQNIGVNKVAKVAGVDKVLIYRYFGNLEGLLKEFASKIDYFANLENALGSPKVIKTKSELLDISKKIFTEQFTETMKNKEMQEILLWELANINAVTENVAEKREKTAVNFAESIKSKFDFDDLDIEAILSIISAGIYYLSIRSRTIDNYTGINLNSKSGEERISNGIEQLFDMIGSKTSEK
jgi:AcrR family transcriptional regulator